MLRASLLLLMVVFLGGAFAQPNKKKREERRERIHAQKIAFISTELDLTPEEAQVFWPVYNAYEAEIKEVRTERKKYMKELRHAEDLSDERAYELFELIFEAEKKESDIRLKYLKKFSEVLGKKKGAKVFIAEEKFKRELLDKVRDRNGHPPPPPIEDRM